jgi:uncharacterized phage protein (TIGR01671 family)
MENRFKFRAWDKKDKIMWSDKQILCSRMMTEEFFDPKNENFIRMQCTGLKDKNGELIYEGDILSLYGFNKKQNEEMERSVVKWDYQEAGFYFGSVTSYNEDNSSFSNTKIIGNIYENPELKTPNQ